MKDTFGREINVGDLIAYSSDSGGPSLSIARVLGPCKAEGSRKIRVRVLHSNTMAFLHGVVRHEYNNGDWQRSVHRPENTPYEAVIGCPSRIVIINGADVPIDAEVSSSTL